MKQELRLSIKFPKQLSQKIKKHSENAEKHK